MQLDQTLNSMQQGIGKQSVVKHEANCETFIREYPGHAPDVFCDALVQYCNDLRDGKMKTEIGMENGGPSEDNRKDYYFFLTEGTLPSLRNTLLSEWTKLGSSQYINEFQHLGTFDYFLGTAKVQMTLPGEGFHHWHYDNAGFSNMSRWFVFITYLNDDFDGGETEFLNQGIRVKPEKGKTVIFPASYTHRHRGNPPINGTKYIATTWANILPRIDPSDATCDANEMMQPPEQTMRYMKGE